MKTQLAPDVIPISHSLKIALVKPVTIESILTVVKFDIKQKQSPYFKKFFQVTPAVQEEANWDSDWFNSYE